jgi:hypothetical protein
MTGSNLTPYDYIIVQRGDKNYRISGDQILNFSMEQIQPQLDEIEMALELEKQLRERGDKQSIDALEDFLQRLEENINQVFPVQDSVFYKYKIDYPNNAELASEYYGCSGQPISVYPRVDDQPTRCYTAARENYHVNLANSIYNTAGTIFLSTHDLTYGAVDALYINRYDSNLTDKQSVLEDNLLPGDVIQINAVTERDDGTTLVDNNSYGLFRIEEDRGSRAGDDGTGSYNPQKELYGFTLKLVAATEDLLVTPNREYQIRFMKSIVRTIDEKYVYKSGDTMTGQLKIELVDITAEDTIDSNGNINTETLSVESSILVKDTNGAIINSGTLNFTDTNGNVLARFDDGTTGLLINYDTGARYDTTIDIVDNEQLTHKLYVDTKDIELEQELDKLSEKVDGLAQITQSTSNIFVDDGTYDTESVDTWAQAVVDNNAITETTFQMWSPVNESRPKGFASALKLIVHEDHLDGNFNWIDNVRTNDILEIVHTPTDTTPDNIKYHYAMYRLAAVVEGDPAVVEHELDDGKKVYELSIEYLRSKGNSLYGDEQYSLNSYDRNTGLSIEATDERYVSLIGDTMTGPLTIHADNDYADGHFIQNTSTGGKILFESLLDGNLHARKGLELGYRNTTDTDISLKIPGEGTIAFNTPNLGFGPKITVGGAPRFHFVGTNTDCGGFFLTNVRDPSTGSANAQQAVTRKWFTSNIKVDEFTPKCHLSVQRDFDDGSVTIGGGGHIRLDEHEDVKVPAVQDRQSGDVLGWNPQENKFQLYPVGETYGPGQNLFVDSEDKCEPGGMWTNKGENSGNPSYYIRVN